MIFRARELTPVRHYLQRAIASDEREIERMAGRHDPDGLHGIANRFSRIAAYRAALRALPRLEDDLPTPHATPKEVVLCASHTPVANLT